MGPFRPLWDSLWSVCGWSVDGWLREYLCLRCLETQKVPNNIGESLLRFSSRNSLILSEQMRFWLGDNTLSFCISMAMCSEHLPCCSEIHVYLLLPDKTFCRVTPKPGYLCVPVTQSFHGAWLTTVFPTLDVGSECLWIAGRLWRHPESEPWDSIVQLDAVCGRDEKRGLGNLTSESSRTAARCLHLPPPNCWFLAPHLTEVKATLLIDISKQWIL